MAPGEDFDSGMESQDNSASKEITPEKKAEIEDNYEEEVIRLIHCFTERIVLLLNKEEFRSA